MASMDTRLEHYRRVLIWDQFSRVTISTQIPSVLLLLSPAKRSTNEITLVVCCNFAGCFRARPENPRKPRRRLARFRANACRSWLRAGTRSKNIQKARERETQDRRDVQCDRHHRLGFSPSADRCAHG